MFDFSQVPRFHMRLPHALFPAAFLLALVLAACGKSGGSEIIGGSSSPGGVPGSPQDLSYGQRIYLLQEGQSTVPQTPNITGTVTSWSIDPALPTGMVFDTSNGGISGAPIQYAPRTTHRVVASNSLGFAQELIVVQVGGQSRFAFGGSSVDGSVTVYGAQAQGDELFPHSWSGSPTPGLVKTSLSDSGEILCAVSADELVIWQVDPVSGHMAFTGTENLGTDNHTLAVHPSGRFVFITSRVQRLVRAYALDPESAAPTLVSQLPTGTPTHQIVVDPLGRFLIVRDLFLSGTGRTPTRSYTINQQSGVITQSANFDLISVSATDMVLGPLGEALYLTILAPLNAVLHCSVNPTTGQLALVSTVIAGTAPARVRVAPDGKRLYAVDPGTERMVVFNIATGNGVLSPDTSMPIATGVLDFSFSFNGQELFLVNSGTNEVTVQTLNADTGAFESATTFRTRPGNLPLLQISSAQELRLAATALYVLNRESADLVAFSIDDPGGTLTIAGSPVPVPGTTAIDLVVEPRGRFVFTCSQGPNQIRTYALQSDGSAVDLNIPTDLFSAAPEMMSVDSSGMFLYISAPNLQQLLIYTIGASGELQASGSTAISGTPTAITPSPGGEHLYVTIGGDGSPTSGEVRPFAVSPFDSTLTPLSTIQVPGFPSSLAFNLQGTQAYITLRSADSVRTYDVAEDGSLGQVGSGSLSQPEPEDVDLSRDGRFAYVVFEDSLNQGGLLLYDINSTSGELYNANSGATQWRDAVGSGLGPQEIAVPGDGSRVYVLAESSEAVFVFEANAADGTATLLQTQVPGLNPIRMGLRIVGQ